MSADLYDSRALKGIGIFVLLLFIALGVATFFVTRPPSQHLDAEGRAWVAEFSRWRDDTARPLNGAVVAIGVSQGDSLPSRFIKPLRNCSASLAELDAPPGLLEVALEDATAACAEIEHALSVNARYGSPALATTNLHLHRASSLLATARTTLNRKLATSGS